MTTTEYNKLRDAFAMSYDTRDFIFSSVDSMAVFAGSKAFPKTDEELFECSVKAQAKIRYMYADAMMAEREKV